jgi:hypothetical protein
LEARVLKIVEQSSQVGHDCGIVKKEIGLASFVTKEVESIKGIEYN